MTSASHLQTTAFKDCSGMVYVAARSGPCQSSDRVVKYAGFPS